MSPQPTYGAFRLLEDGSIDRIGMAQGVSGALDRALCALYAFHGQLGTIEYELSRARGARTSRLRDTLPRPGILLWHGRGHAARLDFLIARSDARPRDLGRLLRTFESALREGSYRTIETETFFPERVMRRFGYERVAGSYDESTGESTYVKRL